MARAGKETGCLDMRTGDRYFVVVRPSLPRVLAMISRDQCFDGVCYTEYRHAPALRGSTHDQIVGSLPI